MILESATIINKHNDLRDKIKNCLKNNVAIKIDTLNQNRKLIRLPENTTIFFNFYPTRDDQLFDYENKILPIYEDQSDEYDDCIWIGWFEKWRYLSKNKLELLQACWKFYWGKHNRDKICLLRAEWVDKNHREDIPQPHWHFEDSIPQYTTDKKKISNDRLDSLYEEKEEMLQEITPKVPIISIKRMHLGMGGWNNHKNHPLNWQCDMTDYDKLIIWSVSVLKSAIDQFSYVSTTL